MVQKIFVLGKSSLRPSLLETNSSPARGILAQKIDLLLLPMGAYKNPLSYYTL